MDHAQPDSAATQRLLQQARAGDPGALEPLFSQHRDFLRQFVELRLDRKLRARVDPSDVVQEAQLEAVRRLPDYLAQPQLPFRLWLRQIALDRLLKARRHHAATARRALGREVSFREGSALRFAQQLLGSGSTPSEQLSRRELALRLRQALTLLPQADREILLMRHFDGLSNPEVGYLLGIDPATVSKRHGRAMLRLHKILFDQGFTDAEL